MTNTPLTNTQKFLLDSFKGIRPQCPDQQLWGETEDEL